MTQQPVPDEYTRKLNEWFQQSFNACLAQHVAVCDKNFETMKKWIDKDFEEVSANLEVIAKCLGGKKQNDGVMTIRSLDDVIATILKSGKVSKAMMIDNDDQPSSTVSQTTLDIVDEILSEAA